MSAVHESADTGDELPSNVVPLRPRLVQLPPPVDEPAAPPVVQPTPVQYPQWPLTLVLSGIALGLAVVLLGSFRVGALCMAGALTLSFILRLVLSDREAGMLKVRSRIVDLCVLGGFSIALLVLGFWVPVPN